MLTAYRADGGKLAVAEGASEAAVWIDLVTPTQDEEALVEGLLRLDIPTRDDMQEIEQSSRIYAEDGGLFLTAQIVASAASREPEIGPVTFVLAHGRLVTVRYHHPNALKVFADRSARQDLGCATGLGVLLALLETVVDRLADILEGEARKLDTLTKAIFEAHRPAGRAETLGAILQRIGRAEDLNGKLRESLSTLQRVVAFLSGQGAVKAAVVLDGDRMKALADDVRSLQEVAAVQGQKILFQLDATLGVINIRQSDIIKIFSVVAFVFLPPTLIASVYGMNFEHMPELSWPWGYPMALGLMVVSALVPYAVFRWKKWL
ncbi:MAG: magnesium transporter CorA family protein [Tabrizicola sp.]|jgi:magnesium transporter|nr:magnesium transporter CorA family protein [Tabrizicola sp.]